MPVIFDGHQSIAISLPLHGMSTIFGPKIAFPYTDTMNYSKTQISRDISKSPSLADS